MLYGLFTNNFLLYLFTKKKYARETLYNTFNSDLYTVVCKHEENGDLLVDVFDNVPKLIGKYEVRGVLPLACSRELHSGE